MLKALSRRHIVVISLLVACFIVNTAFAAESVSIHVGLGTATVNGVLSNGEWSNAAHTSFFLTEENVGQVIPATLYTMNDSHNFYAALVIQSSRANFSESTTLYLDKNSNLLLDNGDEALQLTRFFSASSASYVTRFADSYGSFCSNAGCASDLPDVEDGGTNDGMGAVVNNGSSVVFEWAHPLNSPDTAYDAILAGDHFVRLAGNVTIMASPSQRAIYGSMPPIDVYIAAAGTQKVTIDIAPKSSSNRMVLSKTAFTYVVVLSTSTFDAVNSLNLFSLRFGRTGNEATI